MGSAPTVTKPTVIAVLWKRSISRVTPRGSLSKMIAPSSRGTWNVSNPTTMPMSVFGMVQSSPSHTGTCRWDLGGSAKVEGYRDCVMAMIDVDPVVKELGERFNAAGFELYLVGGVVREAMLGRTSPDMDLATSAKPHETTKVLQGWADNRYHVGVRF